MASGSWAFGGSDGGHFTLNLESHEVSVDTANNRSLIEVTLYMYDNSYSGTAIFNNYVGPPNGASWSMSGTEGGSGNFTYSFSSAGQSVYFVNGTQYWVNHNNDGTGSVSLSASCDANNSPILTTSSGSISYNLTTIQRTANITSFNTSNVTDVGFTINAAVDVTCSQIKYSIDGGSTYTTVSGNATSWSIPVSGLKSGTTYTEKIIVTDAASGLTTTSGTINATTLVQNNFAALGVF